MVATEDTVVTEAATARLTRPAVAVATMAVAGPAEAAVQGHAGRVPVRPSRTRLPR